MNKLLQIGLVGGLALSLFASQAHALRDLSLIQQGELPRDQYVDLLDPEYFHMDQLVVKFTEDTRIRLRDSRLVSLEGWNLGNVEKFLSNHPEIKVERLFSSTEESAVDAYVAAGERQSGYDVADLNNYYMLRLDGVNMDPQGLLKELLEISVVQTCYYEPIPEPASCNFDPVPSTPDWTASQDFRDAAPAGVDIDYAWNHDATYGDGVSWYDWVDLEWGWCETHEDFPSGVYGMDVRNAPDSGVASNYNHGTAVVGVVNACDDNKGMVGLVPDCDPSGRVVSNHASTADALLTIGGSDIASGETYLIEMHGLGPDQGTTCPCNCSQFRYLLMEYWQANFDAILANSTNGRFCIEAAGNGSMDLDWAGYAGAFDLSVRDSQAIVVGASDYDSGNAEHDPSCFTNHGSRISAFGWGNFVYTTGYGYLWNQTGCEQDYTASFSGTSSASPIVTGAAISLALIHYNQEGSFPAPTTLRSRLQTYGTSQASEPTHEINVLPNMKGILAPEFAPYHIGGWDNPIVPSDITGTNTYPTDLAPAPAATYLDWGYVNWSRYGTALHHVRMYRDDVYFVGSNSTQGPFSANAVNDYSTTLRGGLHYLKMVSDPLFEVDESNEGNNTQINGYRWDEMPLVADTPASYTRGPLKSPEGYSNYAVDGFGMNLPGFFEFTGVMGNGGSFDYDLRLYNEAPTTSNGWDSYIHASGYVGLTDFVGINTNNGGSDARYVSVLNWNDSDEAYTVEGDGSSYFGNLPAESQLMGSYDLAAGEVLDVFEVQATVGQDLHILFDHNGGNADLVMCLFGPSSQYLRRSNADWTLNAAGAGESEQGVFTVTESGFHGIAVFKNLDSELNESFSYDLYLGQTEAIGGITHAPFDETWDAELVVRQGGSAGVISPGFVEGPTVADAGVFNDGTGPFAAGSNVGFFVDGPQVYTSGNFVSDMPAGDFGHISNRSLGTIKGGRHEVMSFADVNNENAETNEGNNKSAVQYAWSAFELVDGTDYQRSMAPNFRDTGSPNWLTNPGFNQDGYRFDTGFWTAVAAVPLDATRTLNVHGYDNASTDRDTAFIGPVSSSYQSAGLVNFVVANGNVIGNGVDFNAGVTDNYQYPTSPANGDYIVQGVQRITDLQENQLTSGLLGANELLAVYDLYLEAGESYHVFLEVLNSDNLDVAFFDASADYADFADAIGVLNAGTIGMDEEGYVTAVSTGWHGVVVYRRDASSLDMVVPFNLTIGTRIPLPVIDLTLTPTETDASDGNLHFTLQFPDVVTDVYGDPVVVDHYAYYWSFGPYGVFPGVTWNAWTTTVASELVNFNALIVSQPDLYFIVTAVDTNGRVVASSHSLPAGITESELNSQVQVGTEIGVVAPLTR